MDGRRRRRKWALPLCNLARVRREPRRMQDRNPAKTTSGKIEETTQAQTDDKQFAAGQIKRAFERAEKVQKQKN